MVASSLIADTQNALNKMASATIDRKAAKAAKLTPTASETKVSAGYRPAAAFPYDSPETMLAALDRAEVEVNHVLEGIAVLRGVIRGEIGADDPPERTNNDDINDDFTAKFAAQQAEAQAAAFRSAGKPTPDEALTSLMDEKAARMAAMRAELAALEA